MAPHVDARRAIAGPLILAVAEMQPVPPSRRVCRRNVSLPQYTLKPVCLSADMKVLVADQSPLLSFKPTTTEG